MNQNCGDFIANLKFFSMKYFHSISQTPFDALGLENLGALERWRCRKLAFRQANTNASRLEFERIITAILYTPTSDEIN
jgi:hypothetical protein